MGPGEIHDLPVPAGDQGVEAFRMGADMFWLKKNRRGNVWLPFLPES